MASRPDPGTVPIVRTLPYSNGLRSLGFVFNSKDRLTAMSTISHPLFEVRSFGNQFDNARVSVRAITLPLTFYPINSTNNTFVVNDNGTDRTVTISEGWHTASSLVAEINSDLSAGGVTAYIDAVNNPAFEYTGQIKFSSADTFYLDMDHTSTSDNVHHVLGFAEGVDATATDNTTTHDLYGDSPLDVLGGLRALYVHSSLCPPRLWNSIHKRMDRVAEMVYLDSANQFGDLYTWVPTKQTSFVVSDFSRTSSVEFYITDNLDNNVTLNSDWSIELQVDPLDY